MSLTRRALLATVVLGLVPNRSAAQLDQLLKQLPQVPGGAGGSSAPDSLGDVKIGEG